MYDNATRFTAKDVRLSIEITRASSLDNSLLFVALLDCGTCRRPVVGAVRVLLRGETGQTIWTRGEKLFWYAFDGTEHGTLPGNQNPASLYQPSELKLGDVAPGRRHAGQVVVRFVLDTGSTSDTN